MEIRDLQKPKKNKWFKPVLFGTLIMSGLTVATMCAIQFQHSEEINIITNRNSESTNLKKISSKDKFYKELSITIQKSYEQLEKNLDNTDYNWNAFKQQVIDVNGDILTGEVALDVISKIKIKGAIKEAKNFVATNNKENFKFTNAFYKHVLKKAQDKILELKLV